MRNATYTASSQLGIWGTSWVQENNPNLKAQQFSYEEKGKQRLLLNFFLME